MSLDNTEMLVRRKPAADYDAQRHSIPLICLLFLREDPAQLLETSSPECLSRCEPKEGLEHINLPWHLCG